MAGERLQLSATTGLVRLGESTAVGSELLLDARHEQPQQGCRICYLYETDPGYRALWDGPEEPAD